MNNQEGLAWSDLEPLLESICNAVAPLDNVCSVNWTLDGVQGQLVVSRAVVHINWCRPGVAVVLPAGTTYTDHDSHRHYDCGVFTVLERLAAPTPPTKGLCRVA